MADGMTPARMAHCRSFVDAWFSIEAVFTSKAVTDWYQAQSSSSLGESDERPILIQVVQRGPIRLTDVARATGLSVSSASRVVQRLVLMGLVRRDSTDRDRRVTLLVATDAGRALHHQLCETDLKVLVENLAVFSDEEVATFASLLDRFADRVVNWRDQISSTEPPADPAATVIHSSCSRGMTVDI